MSYNPNSFKMGDKTPLTRVTLEGCSRLNVRKAPNPNSPIAKVVTPADALFVKGGLQRDMVEVFDTKEQSMGYCMSKFLTIK